MATARSPTFTWVARAGNVYMDRSAQVGFSSGTTLSGAFNTSGISVTAAVKNITVTPPEQGWEKSDFLGEDANGFQNQLLDEKPVGTATCTGTLILGEDETIEDYMVSGVVSSPANYTRYQVAKNSDNELVVAIVLKSPSMSDQISFGFDHCRVTKWGDVRIGSADGHWEQDFTVICLAKDFYAEYKD